MVVTNRYPDFSSGINKFYDVNQFKIFTLLDLCVSFRDTSVSMQTFLKPEINEMILRGYVRSFDSVSKEIFYQFIDTQEHGESLADLIAQKVSDKISDRLVDVELSMGLITEKSKEIF
jgi:hypothetical protein